MLLHVLIVRLGDIKEVQLQHFAWTVLAAHIRLAKKVHRVLHVLAPLIHLLQPLLVICAFGSTTSMTKGRVVCHVSREWIAVPMEELIVSPSQ